MWQEQNIYIQRGKVRDSKDYEYIISNGGAVENVKGVTKKY